MTAPMYITKGYAFASASRTQVWRTMASTSTISRRAISSSTSLLNSNNNAEKQNTNDNSSTKKFVPQSQQRDRAVVGPFTWKAGALFLATGFGLYFYFNYERKRMLEQKQKLAQEAKVGRPKVGGPFSLTAHDGTTFTDKDLLGKFSLVYFGFTNCPDICPEELDKMSSVIDAIAKKHTDTTLLPVFITCDPARDTVALMKRYVSDFHPTMVGLTGPYEDIKAACKEYRVYFSTPKDAKPTDSYLVDHSIFFYLMSPEGKFIDAFGKVYSKDDVTEKIDKYINEWKAGERWNYDE